MLKEKQRILMKKLYSKSEKKTGFKNVDVQKNRTLCHEENINKQISEHLMLKKVTIRHIKIRQLIHFGNVMKIFSDDQKKYNSTDGWTSRDKPESLSITELGEMLIMKFSSSSVF